LKNFFSCRNIIYINKEETLEFFEKFVKKTIYFVLNNVHDYCIMLFGGAREEL